MPTAPPVHCATPGCSVLVQSGHCQAHRQGRQTVYNRARGSASARGYDRQWREFREQYRLGLDLATGPDFAAKLVARNRCAGCGATGDLEYDHIVPLSQGGARLDSANVQPLCHACHVAKTSRDAIRPAAVRTTEIIVVCGPPCGGKSTWAQAQGDGVVIDYDYIMARLSSQPLHVDCTGFIKQAAEEYWLELGRAIHQRGKVYAVSAWPERITERYAGCRVVVIDPGQAVCEQRATARPDVPSTLATIAAWYASRAL